MVNLVVTLGNLSDLLGATRSLPSFYVGLDWLGLYQGSFFLGCQVLHLDR